MSITFLKGSDGTYTIEKDNLYFDSKDFVVGGLKEGSIVSRFNKTNYYCSVDASGAYYEADVANYTKDNTSVYKYISIDEILNTDATKITLLADVTADVTIPAGKNITIDLGGYKLTGKSTQSYVGIYPHAIDVEAGATVTIENGTIQASTYYNQGESAKSYVINNAGTLTLKNVNVYSGFYNKSSDTDDQKGFITNGAVICNSGTLTINGGMLLNTLNVGAEGIGIKQTAGKLTINDIELLTIYNGLVIDAGELVINGGTFGGKFIKSIYHASGEIITDPKKVTEEDYSTDYYIYTSSIVAAEGTTVVIKGGNFVAGSADTFASYLAKDTNGNYTALINGETITEVISNESQYTVELASNFVASIGVYGYTTLQAAINNVKDGETIILQKDISTSDTQIEINNKKSITIDFNTHKVTFTADTYGFWLQSSDSITFKNGFIDTVGGALYLGYYNATIDKDETCSDVKLVNMTIISIAKNNGLVTLRDYSELTVDADTIIGNSEVTADEDYDLTSNGNSYGIAAFDYTKVVVYGKVYGADYAITTNGAGSPGVDVTIYSGIIKSTNSGWGIYLPSGKLTVEGGTISGATGIEIRGGELYITGGEIIATDSALSTWHHYDNGTTVGGAAVAISKHTTNYNIIVKISGDAILRVASENLDSESPALALYIAEDITQAQTAALENVTVNVTGGTFYGGVKCDNAKVNTNINTIGKFISGGTFNTTLDSNYVASGYALVYNSTYNNYSVASSSTTVAYIDYGSYAVYFTTLQEAIDYAGSTPTTIVLVKDTAENITISAGKNIEITKAESAVTITGKVTVGAGATAYIKVNVTGNVYSESGKVYIGTDSDTSDKITISGYVLAKDSEDESVTAEVKAASEVVIYKNVTVGVSNTGKGVYGGYVEYGASAIYSKENYTGSLLDIRGTVYGAVYSYAQTTNISGDIYNGTVTIRGTNATISGTTNTSTQEWITKNKNANTAHGRVWLYNVKATITGTINNNLYVCDASDVVIESTAKITGFVKTCAQGDSVSAAQSNHLTGSLVINGEVGDVYVYSKTNDDGSITGTVTINHQVSNIYMNTGNLAINANVTGIASLYLGTVTVGSNDAEGNININSLRMTGNINVTVNKNVTVTELWAGVTTITNGNTIRYEIANNFAGTLDFYGTVTDKIMVGENDASQVNIYGAVTAGADSNIKGEVNIKNGGSLTINAGTVSGDINVEGGSLAINAGSVSGDINVAGGSLTIEDGTFTGTIDVENVSSLTVHGGTFSTIIPNEQLTVGYVVYINSDKTYTVAAITSITGDLADVELVGGKVAANNNDSGTSPFTGKKIASGYRAFDIAKTPIKDADGNYVIVSAEGYKDSFYSYETEKGEIKYEKNEDGDFVLDDNGEKVPVIDDESSVLNKTKDNYVEQQETNEQAPVTYSKYASSSFKQIVSDGNEAIRNAGNVDDMEKEYNKAVAQIKAVLTESEEEDYLTESRNSALAYITAYGMGDYEHISKLYNQIGNIDHISNKPTTYSARGLFVRAYATTNDDTVYVETQEELLNTIDAQVEAVKKAVDEQYALENAIESAKASIEAKTNYYKGTYADLDLTKYTVTVVDGAITKVTTTVDNEEVEVTDANILALVKAYYSIIGITEVEGEEQTVILEPAASQAIVSSNLTTANEAIDSYLSAKNKQESLADAKEIAKAVIKAEAEANGIAYDTTLNEDNTEKGFADATLQSAYATIAAATTQQDVEVAQAKAEERIKQIVAIDNAKEVAASEVDYAAAAQGFEKNTDGTYANTEINQAYAAIKSATTLAEVESARLAALDVVATEAGKFVATVNGKSYATLQAAIDSIESKGKGTITILGDVTEDFSTSGKTITLVTEVANGVTLSGTIEGDLTFDGGKFIVSGTVMNGDVTINSGNVTVSALVYPTICTYNTTSYINVTHVKVNGGTAVISGAIYGCVTVNDGDVTISGNIYNYTHNSTTTYSVYGYTTTLVYVKGGKTIISGSVKGFVRVDGGQVDINGASSDDNAIISKYLTVYNDAVVNTNDYVTIGAVYVYGGVVTVNGTFGLTKVDGGTLNIGDKTGKSTNTANATSYLLIKNDAIVNIYSNAKVSGEIYAGYNLAGSTLTSANNFTGTLTIDGDVTTVFIRGGETFINGTSNNIELCNSANLTIGSSATVNGYIKAITLDSTTYSGKLTISGKVTDSVVATGGTVIINGTADKNAVINSNVQVQNDAYVEIGKYAVVGNCLLAGYVSSSTEYTFSGTLIIDGTVSDVLVLGVRSTNEDELCNVIVNGNLGTLTLYGGAVATINANATVNEVFIVDNAKLDIYGTVGNSELNTFAIVTNGSSEGTKNTQGYVIWSGKVVINIYEGAYISSSRPAMYIPNCEEVNIYGGTITGGQTGIEIRAGKLNITGGTIETTSTTFETKSNGSGSTVIGAALAISKHATSYDLSVSISGDAKFIAKNEGTYALYLANDLSDSNSGAQLDKVYVDVNGGEFIGDIANDNPKVNTPTDEKADIVAGKFISGGTFSGNVPAECLAEGLDLDESGNVVNIAPYISSVKTEIEEYALTKNVLLEDDIDENGDVVKAAADKVKEAYAKIGEATTFEALEAARKAAITAINNQAEAQAYNNDLGEYKEILKAEILFEAQNNNLASVDEKGAVTFTDTTLATYYANVDKATTFEEAKTAKLNAIARINELVEAANKAAEEAKALEAAKTEATKEVKAYAAEKYVTLSGITITSGGNQVNLEKALEDCKTLEEVATVVTDFTSAIDAKYNKYVANIGNVYYDTLQAAIDATGTTETTITLFKDTTENVTISAGQNITIVKAEGVESVTITGIANKNNVTITITNNGILTLNDINVEGQVKNAGSSEDENVINLTLNNVSITNESTALTINAGTVVINGGTYESANSHAVYAITKAAKVTITGGTFTAGKDAVHATTTAALEVTITGGTFKSNGSGNTYYGLYVGNGVTLIVTPANGSTVYVEGCKAVQANKGATVIINGGEFVATGNDPQAVYAAGISKVEVNNGSFTGKVNVAGEMTINGGTFNGDVNVNEGTLSVSGGSFSTTIDSSYIAKDSVLVVNADGTCSAVDKNTAIDTTKYVVQLGNAYYAKLTDAIAAAAKDDTITLLSDIYVSEDYTTLDKNYGKPFILIKKDITIDLNGNSIIGGSDCFSVLHVNKDGDTAFTITIKNSSNKAASIDGNGAVYAIEIITGCQVVFDGGTITVNGIVRDTEGSLLVYSGTVTFESDVKTNLYVHGGTVYVGYKGAESANGNLVYTTNNVSLHYLYAHDSAKVYLGNVTVTGNEVEYDADAGTNYKLAIGATGNSYVKISSAAVVEGSVFVFGSATVDVYGTVEYTKPTKNGVNYFAIATNGSLSTGTTINIYDGAKVTSPNVAIYNPNGTLNLFGGTIEGSTGVYVRGGNLNIPVDSTVKIIANGAVGGHDSDSGAADRTGDALVIDASKGYATLTAVIAGGTFTSANANAIAAYTTGDAQAIIKFVSGGTFNTQIDEELLGDLYALTYIGNGYYGIVLKSDELALAKGDAKLDVKLYAASNSVAIQDKWLEAIDGATVKYSSTAAADGETETALNQIVISIKAEIDQLAKLESNKNAKIAEVMNYAESKGVEYKEAWTYEIYATTTAEELANKVKDIKDTIDNQELQTAKDKAIAYINENAEALGAYYTAAQDDINAINDAQSVEAVAEALETAQANIATAQDNKQTAEKLAAAKTEAIDEIDKNAEGLEDFYTSEEADRKALNDAE
jgi:hypothetical protein